MIRIENVQVVGWEAAIRGMRNPMNSWLKSDSEFCHSDGEYHTILGKTGPSLEDAGTITIGSNDLDLMKRLSAGGPVHAKYRRMITVFLDILAPLYWWKEFDTYRVGTVANSCSTMHKIHAKEFTREDFSLEHLVSQNLNIMDMVIRNLNYYRGLYLLRKEKDDWWQMIQLLPSCYNQRRTVMLNYEVLHNIYISRKDHKLDEWRDFCKWVETLPYFEEIIK